MIQPNKVSKQLITVSIALNSCFLTSCGTHGSGSSPQKSHKSEGPANDAGEIESLVEGSETNSEAEENARLAENEAKNKEREKKEKEILEAEKPVKPRDPEVFCDLGKIVVFGNRTIKATTGCPTYTFEKIQVVKGGVLKITEGVFLKGIGPELVSDISVDDESQIIIKGQKDKPVRISRADDLLNIDLRGIADFSFVDFTNASIWAWGPITKKSFHSLSIDNSKSKTGATALGCNRCEFSDFKDVNISASKDAVPLEITVSALTAIAKGELTIEGSPEPRISVYGNEPNSLILKPLRIANLGYTYKVSGSIVLRGSSFEIDAGTKFEVCDECSITVAADDATFGQIGTDAVTFSALSDKGWPGIIVEKSNQNLHFNHTVLSETSGILTESCGASAIVLKGEGQIKTQDLIFESQKHTVKTQICGR